MQRLRITFIVSLLTMSLCWMSVGYAQLYGTAQQSQAGAAAPETIVFILDASASMNERVGGRTKLDAAKQVILETVRNMPPNIQVGLRVYGHRIGRSGVAVSGPFGTFMTGGAECRQTQLMVAPSPNNRATIASQLVNIDAVGKTPITYSLRESINNDFRGAPGRKTIVLVSDGRETCSYNPCDLALDAVRHGVDVKINTIGFATRDRIADDQLKCVALSTKGKFYSANTAAELAKSLNDSVQVETNVQAKIFTGGEE